MTRTLIIVAHPDLPGSRVNAALADAAGQLPDVTVHDLHAAYPDFTIDVEREQRLLREHDRVVLQFPFYWYSAPPLLKKWLDDVLEYGFAYGHAGTALAGKTLQVVTSIGGAEELYRPDGLNRFPASQLLLPFDATAHLTGMDYAEPFLVHGSRLLTDDELAGTAERYRELLTAGAELSRAA